MTIKNLKYFILLLSFAILISSSLMLLLCNDVDFYDNKSSVCGMNISAIIFILYIIIILFILSFILCLIQCYNIENTKIFIINNKKYNSFDNVDKLNNILNQLP